jgi:sec-independent protein translocase protein TatA
MNIGPAEILVVLVLALIVFGPKRLPEVGRQVGRAVRELRRMQDTMRSELDGVMNPDVRPRPSTPQPQLSGGEETEHSTYPSVGSEQHDEGFSGPDSFS